VLGGENGVLITKIHNKDAIFTDLRGEIEINGKIYSTMTDLKHSIYHALSLSATAIYLKMPHFNGVKKKRRSQMSVSNN